MLTLARRLHEMSWLIELTSQGSFGLWIWFLATCVLQLSDTCGKHAWNIVTQEIALRSWRNWVRVALVLCTSCESHAPGLHRWHVCPWIPWNLCFTLEIHGKKLPSLFVVAAFAPALMTSRLLESQGTWNLCKSLSRGLCALKMHQTAKLHNVDMSGCLNFDCYLPRCRYFMVIYLVVFSYSK